MTNDNKISITFVISGQNVTEEVNVHQPLRVGLQHALEESGNTGRKLEDWQVRDANGNELDLAKKIDELGITPGALIYVTINVGAGGCSSTSL